MKRQFLVFFLLIISGSLCAELSPGLVFKNGYEAPPQVPYPSVEGTYQLEIKFLPLSPIPDPMQPAIAAIDEFFDDPGVALLRILAIYADGATYPTEEPWNVFFDVCAGPNDPSSSCSQVGEVVPTVFGLQAAGIIEATADDGLQAMLGNSGGIKAILSSSVNVLENVDSFRLAGQLDISQEPDENGVLGHANLILINRVDWHWDGTEGQIFLPRELQIRNDSVVAAMVFHPRDGQTMSLEIARLGLPLNYPELLFMVVEKLIFPMAFDSALNSLEDFFAYLIDCEDLGTRLADGGLGFSSSAIEAACEGIGSLYVTGEAWFTVIAPDFYAVPYLETPSSDPCPLTLNPDTIEPTVMELGGPGETQQCKLDAAMVNDEPWSSTPMDATWWGSR